MSDDYGSSYKILLVLQAMLRLMIVFVKWKTRGTTHFNDEISDAIDQAKPMLYL